MISVMDKPEEVTNWIWDKGKSGTEHIVGKILPLGCKNTFRCKNQLGINSNNKKLLKRLKDEGLLGDIAFENSISIIHFYLKNYYIEINGKPEINVFFDENYLTILSYGEENYVIESFNTKIDIKNVISNYIKKYSENIENHYLISVSSQEVNQKVRVDKYEGNISEFEEQLRRL